MRQKEVIKVPGLILRQFVTSNKQTQYIAIASTQNPLTCAFPSIHCSATIVESEDLNRSVQAETWWSLLYEICPKGERQKSSDEWVTGQTRNASHQQAEKSLHHKRENVAAVS